MNTAPSTAPGNDVRPPITTVTSIKRLKRGSYDLAWIAPWWNANSTPSSAAHHPSVATAAGRGRADADEPELTEADLAGPASQDDERHGDNRVDDDHTDDVAPERVEHEWRAHRRQQCHRADADPSPLDLREPAQLWRHRP